jgi:hypothetical protein
MIRTASELFIGLMILGGQAFALFLMVLGAIDLHTHYTEKRERA